MDKEFEKLVKVYMDLLPKNTNVFSPNSLARCWNMNVRTIYYYIESGLLQVIQPTTKYMIAKESVLEFLKNSIPELKK